MQIEEAQAHLKAMHIQFILSRIDFVWDWLLKYYKPEGVIDFDEYRIDEEHNIYFTYTKKGRWKKRTIAYPLNGTEKELERHARWIDSKRRASLVR